MGVPRHRGLRVVGAGEHHSSHHRGDPSRVAVADRDATGRMVGVSVLPLDAMGAVCGSVMATPEG